MFTYNGMIRFIQTVKNLIINFIIPVYTWKGLQPYGWNVVIFNK